MTHRISFERVEARVHGAQDARLVFVDGKLSAVVVRLGESYGELADCWHAEAAFNSLERMGDETFPSLDAVESWVVGHIVSH